MPGPFSNLHPHDPHTVWGVLRWKLGLGPAEADAVTAAESRAQLPLPVPADLERITHPDPTSIQLTWIGHATFLLQLGQRSFLTDPIFSDYCSPWHLPRFRRLFPPGLALKDLPRLDGILISHAHYDHLDEPTLRQLDPGITFYVPLGLRQWFEQRGRSRVVELGWWDQHAIEGALRLHACPVQHFAARSWHDWNRSLWCGWFLEAGGRTIFFAGDTGYCPVFREIHRRLGPVDLAILPIGAYRPRWLMKPMHASPEEAVRMHQDLQARCSVASHWGTFHLTDEPPGEPPVLLRHALRTLQVSPEAFRLMRIGETLTRRIAAAASSAPSSPGPSSGLP